MLDHRLRRWPNISQTYVSYLLRRIPVQAGGKGGGVTAIFMEAENAIRCGVHVTEREVRPGDKMYHNLDPVILALCRGQLPVRTVNWVNSPPAKLGSFSHKLGNFAIRLIWSIVPQAGLIRHPCNLAHSLA